ncbi:MAG: helix-turn-helix transcriptional regulator [Nocardioides sp.]|nr:helix-turn-helix transcriptional regulator [Nocardioides sp.]
MPIGEQIKNLRKERGWSQADLATKINGDAGQISRYENGKITPSVEAIVRFAELFDVSVDYLLVNGALRRPFRQANDELGSRLVDLDQLNDADRAALLHILDGLLANTRIRAALHNAG